MLEVSDYSFYKANYILSLKKAQQEGCISNKFIIVFLFIITFNVI